MYVPLSYNGGVKIGILMSHVEFSIFWCFRNIRSVINSVTKQVSAQYSSLHKRRVNTNARFQIKLHFPHFDPFLIVVKKRLHENFKSKRQSTGIFHVVLIISGRV